MRTYHLVKWHLFVVLSALSGTVVNAEGHCYKAQPLGGPFGEPKSNQIEPVCRALERNLNEFCDQPPMVCELKIHPKYARDLSLPIWKPVHLGGDFGLLEELIRAPWQSAPDPNAASKILEEVRPGIEAAFAEGRLKASTSEIDLYQTGTRVKIYRYDLGDCAQKNPFSNGMGNHNWEVALKSPEIRNYLAPESYSALGLRYYLLPGGSPLAGEVFFFRGKAFTYYMFGFQRKGVNPNLPPINEVRVDQGINFQLNGKPTIFLRNVCELNYQPGRDKK